MALGMSVARAQEEIDSAEFVEWCAFDRLEPYGPERADLNSAIVASTIANANAPKGKSFKPADFMPKYDRLQKRQSLAEMKANFLMFANAHNGSRKHGQA